MPIKTLPIKYKCMLYGMVGLLEEIKSKNILNESEISMCYDLFKNTIYETPSEQVAFLDAFVDVNYIEKILIKGMVQQHKKELREEKKKNKVKVPRKKTVKTKPEEQGDETKPEGQGDETKPEEQQEETKPEEQEHDTKPAEQEHDTKPEEQGDKEFIAMCTEVESDAMCIKVIDDNKYWVFKTSEADGPLFENIVDSDGHDVYGEKVASLVNGKIEWPTEKASKKEVNADVQENPNTSQKKAVNNTVKGKKTKTKKVKQATSEMNENRVSTPVLPKKKAPVVEAAVVPSDKILTQDVYESKDERFEVNHPQDNNKSNTKLKVNK